MTIPNIKTWSSYPLAPTVSPAASILALQNGALVQINPSAFLSAALPQGGNFYTDVAVNTSRPIPLISYAQYKFSIDQLNNLVLFSGSISLTISINGAAINGLSNLNITTTPQNPIATAGGGANNIVNVGNRVTFTLSNANNAVGLEYSMKGTLING